MKSKLQTNLELILNEKNEKIIPENLRLEVEAFGVVGTYTSDATATAEDIKKGKTAYVNGKKIIGTYGKDYKRLEYIESANDQHYIDTGVQALSTIGVELTVQTNVTRNCAFFGGWSNGVGMVFGENINQYYMIAGNGSWVSSGIKPNNTIFHKFVYDAVNKKATVDGITVNINANTGTNTNMWLFRAYEWGENSNGGIRIARCKIYDNGILIRDYIPVIREEDDLVCMYDLVEQNFVIPSGTGSFIAGPEIQ